MEGCSSIVGGTAVLLLLSLAEGGEYLSWGHVVAPDLRYMIIIIVISKCNST